MFGGNKTLELSLRARINALEHAFVINDIRMIKPFRFHNLKGDYDGYFAIDVKTIRDKWMIIIQPLDDNEKAFVSCHIDEIAKVERIVEVKEVSTHYE